MKGLSYPLMRNLGFDMAVVLISATVVWVWLEDPIVRIGTEALLFVLNALAIYDGYRRPQNWLAGYGILGTMFAGSIVFTTLVTALQPAWRQIAILFLSGHQDAASRLSGATLPAGGIIIFAGIFAAYWSVVQLCRFTLMRLGILPNPHESAWSGRNRDAVSK